jgi:hypothetical protein
VTVNYFYSSTITNQRAQMPKSNKAPNTTKKGRGRQSDFSGEKEAFLDGLAKDFLTRKDRSAFYDEAAQGLIEKFGYSRDGKVYVGAGDLTDEEKLEYYKTLRSVSPHSAIWFYGRAYRGFFFF